MHTGTLTDPYGNPISTGTSSPAIDANHIYVYDCSETSGTTFFNKGSGVNGNATLQGTANTSYYIGSKMIGRNVTGFRNLIAGTSGTGGATTGNSCSITGGSVSVEMLVVLNDIKVDGAADPQGAFFRVQNATNTDYVQISSSYYSTSIYASAGVTGWGVASTSAISLVANGSRYHFLLTYDGTNGNIKFYVNGILEGQNSLGGAAALPTLTKIWIGSDNNAGWGCIQSWIAHMRVSNITRSASYAMSSAESFLAL